MKIIRASLAVIGLFASVSGTTVFGITLASDDVLELVEYEFVSARVPAEFNGFKIVQLTDMHNHDLTYDNDNICDMVSAQKPDLIALTGDFVDKYSGAENLAIYKELFDSFSSDVPVFFVDGNHECHAPLAKEFYALLYSYSHFHYLFDDHRTIQKGDAGIDILGLHDPYLDTHDDIENLKNDVVMEPYLKKLMKEVEKDRFHILLSHRPDMGRLYADCGVDLTFCGHTHGGQLNPAPLKRMHDCHDENYRSGYYTLSDEKSSYDQAMIVSNGLGFSHLLPIRYHAPMQLVSLTLKHKEFTD